MYIYIHGVYSKGLHIIHHIYVYIYIISEESLQISQDIYIYMHDILRITYYIVRRILTNLAGIPAVETANGSTATHNIQMLAAS